MCVLGSSLQLPEVWPRTAEVLVAETPALHALLHRSNISYFLSLAGKHLCKACVFCKVLQPGEGRDEKLKDRSRDWSYAGPVSTGTPWAPTPRVQG